MTTPPDHYVSGATVAVLATDPHRIGRITFVRDDGSFTVVVGQGRPVVYQRTELQVIFPG